MKNVLIFILFFSFLFLKAQNGIGSFLNPIVQNITSNGKTYSIKFDTVAVGSSNGTEISYEPFSYPSGIDIEKQFIIDYKNYWKSNDLKKISDDEILKVYLSDYGMDVKSSFIGYKEKVYLVESDFGYLKNYTLIDLNNSNLYSLYSKPKINSENKLIIALSDSNENHADGQIFILNYKFNSFIDYQINLLKIINYHIYKDSSDGLIYSFKVNLNNNFLFIEII